MLWNASALKGYAIEASDGRLGTVSDLLFEDTNWTIRWLVVETGDWLLGRKVLLPLSALGQPERLLCHFPVKLTMQQVKDSPAVDTDLPVSRHTEARVYNYYDWDPYWGSGFSMSNAIATPLVLPVQLFDQDPNYTDGADAVPDDGDPHLRSIAVVTGYHVQATDGEIGHVEDFLVDDADWSIRYITVDTRNWWPGERVLISPYSVREINWPEKVVHLDVSRQKVKDSPPYDPNIAVDGPYNEKFHKYFGLRWLDGEEIRKLKIGA